MISGILLGRFVPWGNKRIIQKGISWTIWGLLFLLGITVGNNRQIMDNLNTIGIEAVVITYGVVAGSVLCAWGVYKLYFSK